MVVGGQDVQRQHVPAKLLFAALIVGIGVLVLSASVIAQARGRVSPGEQWIAIDSAYLKRFPAAVSASIAAHARLCGPGAAVRSLFARYAGSTGREHIALHFDHMRCANRASICGPSGCLHQVYAAVGRSYRLVFDARVGDVELAVTSGHVSVRPECKRDHPCLNALLSHRQWHAEAPMGGRPAP